MRSTTLQPFGFPLHVAVGDEWPAFMRRMAIRDDDDDPRGKVDARTYCNHDTAPARFGVWVHGNGPDAPVHALAGVLAHEAVHVVDFVLEQVGEDGQLQELHAYYVGYITEWLLRAVLHPRV